MSWSTEACCERCWDAREAGRTPVRMKQPEVEICFFCNMPTTSGIYVRAESVDAGVFARDYGPGRYHLIGGPYPDPLPDDAKIDLDFPCYNGDCQREHVWIELPADEPDDAADDGQDDQHEKESLHGHQIPPPSEG